MHSAEHTQNYTITIHSLFPLLFLSGRSLPRPFHSLPLASTFILAFIQSQKSHVCFWRMKWDDILSWWVLLFGFMNSLIHLLFHFHFTCTNVPYVQIFVYMSKFTAPHISFLSFCLGAEISRIELNSAAPEMH